MAPLPISERPRERLLRQGPDALRTDELLALVLGTAGGPHGAAGAAQALLTRFPDLRRMAAAGAAELAEVPGVGTAQACRIKAALALASRLGEGPFRRGEPLGGPREVWERVGRRLALLEHEVFVALALDARNRVVGEHVVARGGVCSVQVLPRDVLLSLVRDAAAGAVFVHNHPSGDPAPSEADRDLTERLRAAGALLGIRVVDHVIAGRETYFAFAEAA